MFMGADLVVKCVLIGLTAASVATWTIALVKVLEAWKLPHQTQVGLIRIRSSDSLPEAQQKLANGSSSVTRLVNSAVDELAKSGPMLTAGGIKERIAI